MDRSAFPDFGFQCDANSQTSAQLFAEIQTYSGRLAKAPAVLSCKTFLKHLGLILYRDSYPIIPNRKDSTIFLHLGRYLQLSFFFPAVFQSISNELI